MSTERISSTTPRGPLVIVGSSLAGVRAAEGARAHGWTGPIVMIGDEPHLPYDRPPLSKAVLDPAAAPALPTLRQPESWEALDVDLRSSTTALGLDITAQSVHTTSGDVTYDRLIIATGSTPRTVPALTNAPDSHTLRTYDDALRIREMLTTAKRITILGGGFIGAEVASAAVARGIDVTIINRSTRPLDRCVGPIAAQQLSALHTTAGVDLRTGVQLTSITEQDTMIRTLHLDDGTSIDTDAVVIGIGSAPSTGWLAGSGLAIDPSTGGIVCDASLATSAPHVWAAGDVASVAGRVSGHWTSAGEQGFIAGANSTGAQQTHGSLRFAWSTWYGHRVQLIGTTHVNRSGTTPNIVPIHEVSIHETLTDEGVVEYHESGRVVGAMAIDNPGRIARLRRELTSAGAETSRPVGTTSARRAGDSTGALR